MLKIKLVLVVFVVISWTLCESQIAKQSNVLEIVSLLAKLENAVPNSNLSLLLEKYYDVQPSLKELEKIDSICSKQIRSVIGGVHQKQLWAIKMMDSSAKIPAGVLYGNIINFGNYEECVEVQHNDTKFDTEVKGKYCSAVVSTSKSTQNFDLLAENLAEFDFSEVRMIFGLCVPSGCSSKDLQTISDVIFPDLLPIRLTFMEKFCSTEDSKRQLPTRTTVGIILFCSFGLLLVLGTIADMSNSSHNNNDFLRCFSVYTNGKKLFSSRVDEDSLLCLNGLRVLSMLLIILGHRLLMTEGLPAVNRIFVERWKNDWFNYIFIGLGFAVDTFFSISGLLVVYLVMRAYEKGQSIKWGLFYLHRFLRLTPSLLMIVLFYATMVNLIEHEPFAVVDEYLGQPCREYWWTTILYIQNYWNPNNMCAVHTWYLAIDTHLYILSPLLLIGLKKYPKKTIASIILITLLSICAAFEVTWRNKLGATYLNQNPEEYSKLYTPTHMRVPSWLLGALTGYFIAKYRGQPLKISKLSVFSLWMASLSSLLLVLFVQKYYHDNEYNVWSAAVYNSLARPLWAAAICVIILLCVFGHGGIVNSLLSCTLFNVLIRINYAVYLVHIMVSVSIAAKLRTPVFLSNFGVIHETLGDYIVILLVAILWTLAFESPIIALEKILIPKDETGKNKCSLEKNDSNLSNGSCETIIVK